MRDADLIARIGRELIELKFWQRTKFLLDARLNRRARQKKYRKRPLVQFLGQVFELGICRRRRARLPSFDFRRITL